MRLPGEIWALSVLAVVLIASAVTDVRRGRIPNVITYGAIVVGLVGHTLLATFAPEHSIGLGGSLAGLLAGFVPMLVIWLAGGIGGGDAKLMGAVGALMGWQFVLAAMFWGFIVAALLAVVIMIRRRVARRTLGRVGRFLVLLALPGKKIDPASPDSPKVPFGLALCIGAAIAVAMHIAGLGLRIAD